MKPLPERLNDRLEEQFAARRKQFRSPAPGGVDPEVDELLALAQDFPLSPSLQVDPVFAQRLEREVIASAIQRRQVASPWWQRLVIRPARAQFALAAIMISLLFGTGTVLAMAAQTSNPTTPLYAVKRWEQHVQLLLTNSSQGQAEVSLQIAREHLNVLADLANPTQAAAYHQALADLNQQLATASRLINALPAGPDQQRLSRDLTALQADSRHILRHLLPSLALSEQLATTSALERLGEPVPGIKSVVMIVASHPKAQATISITGSNLSPGAHLIVDNRLLTVDGIFLHGTYTFVIPWHSQQPPNTITLLNTDGTGVQTAVIAFIDPDGHATGTDGNNSNGTNNPGKNNGGKPPIVPTIPIIIPTILPIIPTIQPPIIPTITPPPFPHP